LDDFGAVILLHLDEVDIFQYLFARKAIPPKFGFIDAKLYNSISTGTFKVKCNFGVTFVLDLYRILHQNDVNLAKNIGFDAEKTVNSGYEAFVVTELYMRYHRVNHVSQGLDFWRFDSFDQELIVKREKEKRTTFAITFTRPKDIVSVTVHGKRFLKHFVWDVVEFSE
jgi:hypothetical protein